MNLYRVIDKRIDLPDAQRARSITTASPSSWSARQLFALGYDIDVTDIIARRIRIGDTVQVRDKRDNAIAVGRAELLGLSDDGYATIKDGNLTYDVPVACVEPLPAVLGDNTDLTPAELAMLRR